MEEKYLMKLARQHGYSYRRDESGELVFRSRTGRQSDLYEGGFLDALQKKLQKKDLLRLVKTEKQFKAGFKDKDYRIPSRHKEGRVIGPR